MLNKTDQIRTAWAVGDPIGALRIAAKFYDRSEVTKAFKRGIDAYNHPDFYMQIGKEPQELMTAALALCQYRESPLAALRYRRSIASVDDHVRVQRDHLLCECGQTIQVAVGGTTIDLDQSG